MIQRGSISEAFNTRMEPEPLVYITHEQHYFLREQLPKKARQGKCANQQIREEFEINPSPSQCHILGVHLTWIDF